MIVLLFNAVMITDLKLIIRHLIRFALTPDKHEDAMDLKVFGLLLWKCCIVACI